MLQVGAGKRFLHWRGQWPGPSYSPWPNDDGAMRPKAEAQCFRPRVQGQHRRPQFFSITSNRIALIPPAIIAPPGVAVLHRTKACMPCTCARIPRRFHWKSSKPSPTAPRCLRQPQASSCAWYSSSKPASMQPFCILQPRPAQMSRG